MTLPFGLQSAPFLFDEFSSAFEWIIQNQKDIPKMINFATPSPPQRGTLGFVVLAIFRLVFGFRNKKLRFFGFGVFCSLWVFLLLAFGFRFPANAPAVFGFGIQCGYRFFPFGFGFLCSNSELNYASQPLAKTLLLRKFSNSLQDPSTQSLFNRNG